jgi:hypothetical protein
MGTLLSSSIVTFQITPEWLQPGVESAGARSGKYLKAAPLRLVL